MQNENKSFIPHPDGSDRRREDDLVTTSDREAAIRNIAFRLGHSKPAGAPLGRSLTNRTI